MLISENSSPKMQGLFLVTLERKNAVGVCIVFVEKKYC